VGGGGGGGWAPPGAMGGGGGGAEVRLIVTRAALTQTVERLLGELQVEDLTVTDPPIEEVIGRLFKEGALPPFGRTQEFN